MTAAPSPQKKKKKWIIREREDACAAQLASGLGVSPIVASLLISRGYDNAAKANAFLNPSLDQLHDPSLMLGMSEAVERLLRAIEKQEPILIYGDYDVDGTTGTAVLLRALRMLSATAGYHVPHRFTEGYGIRQEALEQAAHDGYKLVVSVDCGITAHEPLHWARANGLDIIVTDHHLPDADEGAPPALAVLNPNQRGCSYPDKNLAGVGVAFKLIHALFRARGREAVVPGFLKMVAIGTVADVAKLIGENRAIVALGLSDLPRAVNPGLRALIDIAGCGDDGEMTAYDLGFRIGPRINAAGRMDAARAVVELFDAQKHEAAKRLAEHLDTRNRERMEAQREIFNRAIEEFESSGTDMNRCYAAVIAGDGWHRGVIGLAASKIAERLNRPCVVISLDGDVGHGSARSIAAYHLFDGITSCRDLLDKFGGHSHAAGLSIKREHIDEFRRRLNEHAASCLTEDDLIPAIEIDAEVSPKELGFKLSQDLRVLEPFGAGNPRPVFMTRGFRLISEPQIIKEQHVKLRVCGDDNRPFEAIWWRGVDEIEATPRTNERIDLAYEFEARSWQGDIRLQLNVRDMRAAE
ncbi:MAG TPA: single-stranded-DNA-specific exonuclease RecJ [Pyrinomonadaceae bacterium]|jgi:single-stranded-DNA-specific exonuclease|nr:single-stranded-DNA-specific exonuclease RecJ [Pyrinomonadaceae bacterium]